MTWFEENEMTANPSKFQAIAIGNKYKDIDNTSWILTNEFHSLDLLFDHSRSFQ